MQPLQIPSILAVLSAGLVSCGENPPSVVSSGNLHLLGEHRLAIPEPSGLTLSGDGKSLLAVSDNDGRVYQLDFRGKVLGSFSTGLRDLEGIAAIDATTLAVLAEREREIVVFSTGGTLLRRGKINIPGSDNKGPEALAYDAASGNFLIIKENPGLFIRIDPDFNEISRTQLNFARDYSGISHEPVRDQFWVMSDQSGTIHVLNRNLAMQTSFSTNIPQLEGVAIDHAKRLLYVVSDPLATLYVFRFREN